MGANSGSVTVTPSNACGNGTASNLAVSVLNIPSQPSAISGSSSCCANSTQIYSVTLIAGVTYTWSFPADWIILSGQGTSSVTVTAGVLAGNIQVVPSNACGSGTAQTLAVTILNLPSQPSTINGVSMACKLTPQVFSVTNVAGIVYAWTVPAGWAITSGQGTNSILVTTGNASGNVTVTPSNSCGNGPSQSIAVTIQTSTPAQPAPITGNTAPCAGTTVTYSTVNVSGVTYTWSLPAGWSIQSGQGTNSISVTVGPNSGTISVSLFNTCGGGLSRNLAVSVVSAIPAASSPISGNNPVCAGSVQVYSVLNTANTTFTWTVPADWTISSGQGTNSLTVNVGASSGSISVIPSNSCGTATGSTLAVQVQAAIPAQPSPISGNLNPCEASTQIYNVTSVSGVEYSWSLPVGWSIISGQGSNEIQVTVGSQSGVIQVVPSNSCGTGSSVSISVTVSPLPTATGVISGITPVCEGTSQTYSVVPVLGITYTWATPSDWIINSGQGTSSITSTIGALTGDVVVTPSNSCGNGPSSVYSVVVNLLPLAVTGPNSTICEGASIQLGAAAVPGNTYSWTSVPAGFTSSISNPVVTPAVSTEYTLVETNTTSGCSQTHSALITLNQVINVTVNPVSQLQTICSGTATNIGLTSNITGTVFTWNAVLSSGSNTTFNTNGSGNQISEIITNTSSLNSTVIYHITATADVCTNTSTDVTVTIQPVPIVSNQSKNLCSDVAIAMNLGSSTNGVSASTYNITSINSNGLTASAGNPVTGNGFTSTVIADDAWTNAGLNPVNVTYTIVPVSSLGCDGSSFTVTITINPKPVLQNPSAYAICSGASTSISLLANIPSSFAWTIGTITGSITGASAGSGSSINQALTNPSSLTDGSVEYLIVPTSSAGSCIGTSTSIIVTVHPLPVVTSLNTYSICSGSTVNISLTSSISSNFSWAIGTITGSVSGYSSGVGATINQTLVNSSSSNPGSVQYIVTPTSTGNSCQGNPYTITVAVNPIPTVTAGVSSSSVCPGSTVNLTSSSNIVSSSSILSENFNAASNTWTKSNSSSGGTTANATWTLRPDGYVTNSNTFHSNDASQFYLSDSRSQNGTVTATTLVSPVLNTNGYSNLSLSFWQYYDYNSTSGEYAKVEVTTNGGSTWTTVATYNNDRGSAGSFQNESINLGASYINSSNFQLRFNYYCGSNRGRYWGIDNVSLTGTPSVTAQISWISDPPGFTSNLANPINVPVTVTTNYTVTYVNSATLCGNSATVSVSTLPVPDPVINADYCSSPGKIKLTSSPAETYYWNTGESTQEIYVDVAGMYSVTVTNSDGCSATAFLSVSTELVVNGDFSTGNSGFTSGYSYDPTANGLIAPESEYAINSNAHYTHTNFWGYDHTNGSGTGNNNFLIVNGAKFAPQPYVWRETVTVLPNTDYYFSAWAISLNNVAPYAELQFSVNGAQVGTIAYLTSGQNILTNPWQDKDRFYGSWNSGSATTAVIEILDLNTSANGNDFGLDDISFGTLAQIPFTISPSYTTSGSYCIGETVQLLANIVGGRPPISFSWTGPNGFTSNLQDPIIPNVQAPNQGIYTLTVTDGYGCTPTTGTVEVHLNSLPGASFAGPHDLCQFSLPGELQIIGTGGVAPYTFTYNINGGANQVVTTNSGNTAYILVPTGSAGTFIYNLVGVTSSLGCSSTLNSSYTIQVHTLPVNYITGSSPVCPNSTGNIYSGPPAMNGYAWTISGNGAISGQSNQVSVNITAGNSCNDLFLLTLMASNTYGCTAISQEEIVIEDITAPVVACPANINSPSDPGQTYGTIALSAPVYSDDCSSAAGMLIGWSMSGATNASGSGIISSPYQFNIGITQITYTITDVCGNSSSCLFTITITQNDPPLILCPANITVGAITGLCNAMVDPGQPTISQGLGVTISWNMTGATTGSGTGSVLPNPYQFNLGTTIIMWIGTNASGADTCLQTIIVLDQEPPDFIAPAPQSYCVIDIIDATFFDPTTDITPDRPEYYILTPADKANLSPDPSSFTDNCTPTGSLVLHWRIDFNGGNPVPISGVGAVSLYSGEIRLPGDPLVNVIHTITYWLIDSSGNSSAQKTVQLTVKPRPNIIKQ
ncbi:MAG: HYR domain-containing protein [Bacteroidales bacterium]|nr:HYR domain-containing protein [Bacteroidales bacterium]